MRVGIPAWMNNNTFGVNIDYISFIRETLQWPEIIMLFPESPIYTNLDLLVLPGGADINPLRYGQSPSFYTDKPDLIKEYFDVHKLPRYVERKTPIFGICRGCQAIAVHFGEQLHQNMYHETNKSDDPYDTVHSIHFLGERNKKDIKVNSRHHQSIIKPKESSIVKVIATHSKYPEDIEAIRVEGYPIYGVQYHPESLNDRDGVDYAIELIEKCLKEGNQK